MDKKDLLRSIPKIDELMNSDRVLELEKGIPRVLLTDSAREAVNSVRERILASADGEGHERGVDVGLLVDDIERIAKAKNSRHLRKVINGTGVILHTNLGRSILCTEALDAIYDVAEGYSNLEYDLDTGGRGSRYSHIDYLVERITGAESAMAVNNNAGAVLLTLGSLCAGREVVISRGELVEIGGSFRIPEVMEQSGAKLVEVGTTNKTHILDYENAIGESTGALLKVHTSNYRIMGFTESPDRGELVELGHRHRIPVIEDIGSGCFIDFSKYGLEHEPTVQEAISAGADIVTFSGDKMLGGPQAGIIAGSKRYIDLIKKNPLTRALRIDKMTAAALEATLRQYMSEERAVKNIPTLRMMTEPKEMLKDKAEKLCAMLRYKTAEKAAIDIADENSCVGGGSMPTALIPTYAVRIRPLNMSANAFAERMRSPEVPIIARTSNDSALLDLRTIDERDFETIADEISDIMQEG